MIYHVRYKNHICALKALNAYQLNKINAEFETYGADESECRDIRADVNGIDQERASVRIDSKYNGFVYTPYTKDSEW